MKRSPAIRTPSLTFFFCKFLVNILENPVGTHKTDRFKNKHSIVGLIELVPVFKQNEGPTHLSLAVFERNTPVSPQVFVLRLIRHTFGSDIREKTGSDSETARLLGHTSIKYVGRYTRATDQERAELLESRCRTTNSPPPQSPKKKPKPKKPTKEPAKLSHAEEKKLRQDFDAERNEREIAAFLAAGNVSQKALAALYKVTPAHIREINKKLKTGKVRLSPEEIQIAKKKRGSIRRWFKETNKKLRKSSKQT
jgi:hypothetical protein